MSSPTYILAVTSPSGSGSSSLLTTYEGLFFSKEDAEKYARKIFGEPGEKFYTWKVEIMCWRRDL
jgi:ABC-type lipoprotein export system ATPase subunit